jgi:hypothetical protein
MKYYIVILFLISFCSLSQNYSFSSIDISERLTSGSVTVDSILVNEASIGLNSSLEIVTLANGTVSLKNEIKTTSDARVKNNITSFGPSLEMILKIQPKKYNMLEQKSQRKKIGFLAQDVKHIFPELVSMNKNKMLAVNYQGLIPLMINSLNELTYKNIALKNRIKNLKERIANNH